MKKKNFRLLLAAVLTTVMLASAMPAMAQTESVSQNGEDEIMLISADPAAASVKWTSSKLKAAKVDFTKVASGNVKVRKVCEDCDGEGSIQRVLHRYRQNLRHKVLLQTTRLQKDRRKNGI